MNIQRHVSLRNYNTFGIEAVAEYFASAASVQELSALVKWAKDKDMPVFILGGGSNILLTRPVAGLTISIDIMGISASHINDDQVLMSIGAGENWHKVVWHAIDHEWGGIENLSLIPGKTGAAPIQNIGAYGVELRDSFHSLKALSLEDEALMTFYPEDCAFGYRDSYFKHDGKGRYAITEVKLMLNKTHTVNTSYGAISQTLEAMGVENPTIADVGRAVTTIRQRKLPDPKETGNAGSFFKNPVVSPGNFEKLKAQFPDIPHYTLDSGEVKIPAAWLIEQCGWKGKRLGNVASHQQQPLVLVNLEGATGDEVLELAGRIQQDVLARFDIELTPEVNIL